MDKPADNKNRNPALEDAIRAAGGLSQLARKLTLHTDRMVLMQNIDRWRKHTLPPMHCPAIEAVTGVKCEKLRPDIQFIRKQKIVTGYVTKL